jgi:hypothetical protein
LTAAAAECVRAAEESITAAVKDGAAGVVEDKDGELVVRGKMLNISEHMVK